MSIWDCQTFFAYLTKKLIIAKFETASCFYHFSDRKHFLICIYVSKVYFQLLFKKYEHKVVWWYRRVVMFYI